MAFKRVTSKKKDSKQSADSEAIEPALYQATQCFFRDVKIPDKHLGCVRRDINGHFRPQDPHLSAKKQQKAEDEHRDTVKSNGEAQLSQLAKLYHIKASNKYDKYAQAFTKHYAMTRMMPEKADPVRELSIFQWLTMKMPKGRPGPPTLADIEWVDSNAPVRLAYNETPYEWMSTGMTVLKSDNMPNTNVTYPHHIQPLSAETDRRISYASSVSSGASYHTAPIMGFPNTPHIMPPTENGYFPPNLASPPLPNPYDGISYYHQKAR